MLERKRRVENILESMGRMVVPVPDESEAERERVIRAVDLRLGRGPRILRLGGKQRWVAALAAAALCVVAGASLAHFLPAQPVAAQARAELFKRGDALHTVAGEARTGLLENGAKVQVSGSTEFTVSALLPGNDELVLDRGRVELVVPKLRSGHTLSVTTPDTSVTVRGTRFSVEVTLEGSRAITGVEVTEGSVWVRQGDARLVLEAGSHWSSRATIPPASVLADPAPEAVVAPTPVTDARPVRGAGPAPVLGKLSPVRGAKEPVEESSTLGQENDLYAAASRAAREGNDALAVANLNGLLTRYPNSPLVQNVRVDRFRALDRSGRTQEAVSQARRYLADYPNGFARDEAKAIVLQALARP